MSGPGNLAKWNNLPKGQHGIRARVLFYPLAKESNIRSCCVRKVSRSRSPQTKILAFQGTLGLQPFDPVRSCGLQASWVLPHVVFVSPALLHARLPTTGEPRPQAFRAGDYERVRGFMFRVQGGASRSLKLILAMGVTS